MALTDSRCAMPSNVYVARFLRYGSRYGSIRAKADVGNVRSLEQDADDVIVTPLSTMGYTSVASVFR